MRVRLLSEIAKVIDKNVDLVPQRRGFLEIMYGVSRILSWRHRRLL